VSQDDLDHEHVRDGIAHGLVDEIADGSQRLERVLLGGGLGLLLLEDAQSVLREDDGAVTIGLELHADIELAGGVVKVLNTGGGAYDWELEVFLDVGGASTVGVGRLHDTDAKIVLETSRTDQVADEGCV
jgi:hypothetical protein